MVLTQKVASNQEGGVSGQAQSIDWRGTNIETGNYIRIIVNFEKRVFKFDNARIWFLGGTKPPLSSGVMSVTSTKNECSTPPKV